MPKEKDARVGVVQPGEGSRVTFQCMKGLEESWKET